MKTRRSRGTALLLAGSVALGLLAFSGVVLGGQRGICTSATVDEPFLLPDGSLHEPGKITLCADRAYSPVSWMHAAYVDRMPVAMLLSRAGTSEGRPRNATPFIVLHRDGRGLLHLAGYAVPSGRGEMLTYRMDLARVRDSRHEARNEGPAGSPAGPSKVILAASIR